MSLDIDQHRGISSIIIFRYEKVVDLYFSCGRLNHQDKDYTFIPPNGKKCYGPWMRASGQNPILLSEIAVELDRLNATIPDLPLSKSPKTPVSKALAITPQPQQDPQKQKMKMRQISSIPFDKLWKDSPTVLQIEEMDNPSNSNALCMEKPDWKTLIPKPTQLVNEQAQAQDVSSPYM